jgi:nicotinate-nucleotide pyrophosphorylase (carboxylating)
VVAGIPGVVSALERFDSRLHWTPMLKDGAKVEPGDEIGQIEGPAAGLLSAERTVLNFLSRLSGIATLTARYVEAVRRTKASIYDTRKTVPGWRRLAKYAVRCGGGQNHRVGLYEAILIKDNHLAFGADGGWSATDRCFTPAEAVRKAREFVEIHVPAACQSQVIIEIEVDTLQQLEEVLPERPDIVLLDNMSPEMLQKAVACRNDLSPGTDLEASGGVHIETVRAIAEAGVERISVGALTHSAICLDFGLDWLAMV